MSLALIWIGVALVFALVEVTNVSLFAAFLALGALVAAGAAALGFPGWLQVVVLAVVATGGVIVARPQLLRILRSRRQGERLPSGAESMIGRQAAVVDAIEGPHGRGHVRISGEDWPARSEDGESVAVGASVAVRSIEGATLVVSPLAAASKEE